MERAEKMKILRAYVAMKIRPRGKTLPNVATFISICDVAISVSSELTQIV